MVPCKHNHLPAGCPCTTPGCPAACPGWSNAAGTCHYSHSPRCLKNRRCGSDGPRKAWCRRRDIPRRAVAGVGGHQWMGGRRCWNLYATEGEKGRRERNKVTSSLSSSLRRYSPLCLWSQGHLELATLQPTTGRVWQVMWHYNSTFCIFFSLASLTHSCSLETCRCSLFLTRPPTGSVYFSSSSCCFFFFSYPVFRM